MVQRIFAATAFLLGVAVVAYECPSHQTGTDLLKELKANMTGKVVVINGGDSGIGLGGATAMASAGAKLIFLTYNTAHGDAAIRNITRATGNTKMIAIDGFDLSSLKAVRHVANRVAAFTSQIDVLVLDAGAVAAPAGKPNITADGLEYTFQVNFLGHVLLAELLLPALRKVRGRIVYTSSISGTYIQNSSGTFQNFDVCAMSGLPEDCTELHRIANIVTQPPPIMPGFGYPSLAELTYWTRQFYIAAIASEEASKRSGVRALAFHPGVVQTPAAPTLNATVIKGLCAAPAAWFQCLCYTDMSTKAFSMFHCPKTIYEGGSNLGFLAAASDLMVNPLSGKLTVACGDHGGAVADPVQAMARAQGGESTKKYMNGLMELWRGMISSSQPAHRD